MKNQWLQIIILFIVAVFVVFFRFNQVPKNLSFDEVEFAKVAINLDKKPYVPYSNLATGHSTLYFYIILASFKIFGINNFALRFPSALFGVLNVIIVYLVFNNVLSKKSLMTNNRYLISNKILPFIFTVIFLSLRWYFNFARFSFEATFLLFLELVSLFFLLKRKPNLIISGLFAGLAFNSYTPGRIFFLVPLLYLFITKNKTKIFPFLISFLILIIPLSSYLIRNPDIRFNQQSYLTNENVSLINKFSYLGQNIFKTALMFNVRGDVNGRHNYPLKPALNPLIGILFLTGLIISIRQRYDKINQLFLTYFIFSLVPTILTFPHENPHMLRTFTTIPSVVYFVVLGLYWLTKFIPHRYRKISLYVISILLILSAVYEARTYFYYQNRVFKQAFEVKQDLSQIVRR